MRTLTVGTQVGRLTITSFQKGKVWCSCLCGNTVLKPLYHLRQIVFPTCGKCKIKENYPREYKSYDSMKQRCINPSAPDYSRYGGRGIIICDRWRYDFFYFLQDMGRRPEGHTLDRIDANGNYCKENCRWADTYTQQNNKVNSKPFTADSIIYTPNGYWR